MNGNGSTDHILRPRAIKPGNPQVLRAQEEESGGKGTNGAADLAASTVSRSVGELNWCDDTTDRGFSGRSTPLPPDAPPSAQHISTARRQIRHKQRLFPTIDYAARVSHFDPRSEYADFRGFFTLFWIGLAIMVITTMLRNIKDTGHPMRVRIWALFTIDVWQLGLADLAMVCTTAVSLPLQVLFRSSNGVLRWSKGGMAIQSIYQSVWLTAWVMYVAVAGPA